MTPELPASATKSQRTQSELTLQSFDLGACLHERFEQQVERTVRSPSLPTWKGEALMTARISAPAS